MCAWKADEAHVVNLKTGRVLWQAGSDWKSAGEPGRYPTNALANSNALFRIVHGAGPADQVRIEALDLATRKQLWQSQLDAKLGYYSLLSELGGKLFLRSRGRLWVMDAANGRLQWQFNTGADPSFSEFRTPLADEATVYVCDWNGTVWALDAKTGPLRWRNDGSQPAPGRAFVSENPTLDGGVIYLTVNETQRWPG